MRSTILGQGYVKNCLFFQLKTDDFDKIDSDDENDLDDDDDDLKDLVVLDEDEMESE